MSLKALSDYTVYSRYAHYLPEKKRRETWDEITERVFAMHARKYATALESNPEFKTDFEFAKEMVRKKRVLGSQRALQFGGKWIEDKNLRLFNCATSYVDRPRAFQEMMFTLLCGTGMGFSVQKQHVKKLPDIAAPSSKTKTYQIPDSIEGWSDAIGVLMASYFVGDGEFKEYRGVTVRFDYSHIRPEGALISGQFKAPGPKGLEKALENIRALLNKRLANESFTQGEFAGKLRAIDAYDIVMYASDAVLSGGVRRSATICIFSLDDNEMRDAKTGNWFVDNPQRARSNNSAALLKNQTTREQFAALMKSTREFGEPGFIWLDNLDVVFNPYQPAWAPILTKDGLRQMKDIDAGMEIWSESGWTKVVKKWSTGVKKVFRYQTTGGVFFGTENHRVVCDGEKVEAGLAEGIDQLIGPYKTDMTLDTQDVIDGIVFGDGSVHGASNNLVYLCIGQDDQDYLTSEVKRWIGDHRPGLSPYAWEIDTRIKASELPLTYLRSIPERYMYGSFEKAAAFLRGLYTANGSIVADRVTLKASSFRVIQQVQIMLSALGIRSYYTTNRPTTVAFFNGEYLCRESYDLNITKDRVKFASIIGFIQSYKTEKLEAVIRATKPSTRKPKTTYDIASTELISEEEVFDITVDNGPHTYWTGGLNVSNCCEIGMIPSHEGESGVQVCNLVEINGRYCEDKERFLECCRAAGILGTMQAGYTDFKYLTPVSKVICDKEALLGCSITGIMDNPEVLLDSKLQQAGAKLILEQNATTAKMIGVNPTARATCVKPAGSTSCVLKTASGIHPHHAKRYIRRVQANHNEFPLQLFKSQNPHSVETSVWSASGTDDVISFLCEVPKGAKLKNDVSAIEFLSQARLTQNNWVEYGTRPELCTDAKTRHNVSMTAVVRDDEWDKVEEYIFKHQKDFAGISLLPASGDLDYPQAPFATVLTPEEIVLEYGDGSIIAAGLVVDGLAAFGGNLWKACDAALGRGGDIQDTVEPDEPKKPRRRDHKSEKAYTAAMTDYALKLNRFYTKMGDYRQNHIRIDWVRRAKQFAERYFKNDLRKATYCLKHVSLWHTWLTIRRTYKDIDWANVVEETETHVSADTLAGAACSGGQCELK